MKNSTLNTLHLILQKCASKNATEEQQQMRLEDLTAATGASFTLFEKTGSDFVRKITTVRVQDGAFAVGTKLDITGDAYNALSKGKNYQGIVSLFGVQYYASYILSKNCRVVKFVAWLG